jgi:hypothetical protein
MGSQLATQARKNWDRADIRLVDMPPRALATWQALLLLADDETGVYDQGWQELSWATGVVSERTVMRAIGYLRDAGLVEPLPRTPGQFRAYRLHP